MPPRLCSLCGTAKAIIKRPKTGSQVCKDCFFEVFETEVHNTIIENGGIFKRGDKVAIGASGGKGKLPSSSKDCAVLIFRNQTRRSWRMSCRRSTRDMIMDWIYSYSPSMKVLLVIAMTHSRQVAAAASSDWPLTVWYIDRQAESDRVRATSQDSEL